MDESTNLEELLNKENIVITDDLIELIGCKGSAKEATLAVNHPSCNDEHILLLLFTVVKSSNINVFDFIITYHYPEMLEHDLVYISMLVNRVVESEYSHSMISTLLKSESFRNPLKENYLSYLESLLGG